MARKGQKNPITTTRLPTFHILLYILTQRVVSEKHPSEPGPVLYDMTKPKTSHLTSCVCPLCFVKIQANIHELMTGLNTLGYNHIRHVSALWFTKHILDTSSVKTQGKKILELVCKSRFWIRAQNLSGV